MERPFGAFYVVVFEWRDGEYLFDFWNFEKYKKDTSLKSPKERFRALPAGKKQASLAAEKQTLSIFPYLKLILSIL